LQANISPKTHQQKPKAKQINQDRSGAKKTRKRMKQLFFQQKKTGDERTAFERSEKKADTRRTE